MRWYDYIVCVLIADLLSASLLTGNIFTLAMSIFAYWSYEDYRKEQVK
jgi:antibiotic biosynthesis monooxygenase (ABM) superfamily enzyme